jgi:hypothetical protein
MPNNTVLLKPGDTRMLAKTKYRDMLDPGKYRISQSREFAIGWRSKEEFPDYRSFTTGELEFVVAAGPDVPWGEPVEGVKVRLGASKPLGLFYSNNTLWFEVQNNGAEAIEFNTEPLNQKGQGGSGHIEILDSHDSPVEYIWRGSAPDMRVEPGKSNRNHFVNGRPLRKHGPGTYTARVTLVVHSVESRKTFKVKSNWHQFQVTPCGYSPEFAPKTAYGQIQQANAYHAMVAYGHATKQEIIGRYEAIIEKYPNSKYELESHFGIAKAASEDQNPNSVTESDYALSRRHYQEIIRKWPDVVTYHTIHVRYQAYCNTPQFGQSRIDLYKWLTSLTTEQKANSVRNYCVVPFELSEDDIQHILAGSKRVGPDTA